MKPLRQGELFDDGSSAADAAALVAVTASERPLSAAQRTFNRLTEEIRREREALAGWEAYLARFRSRLAAELRPLERELRGAQRRLVLRLDALLAGSRDGERLNRRHRAKVRSYVVRIIDSLLEDGPDPELEALYDRHSEVSRAQRRREDMALAEELVSEILGPKTLEGHEARDADELFLHAGARFTERIEAEARERDQRKAERAARRARPGAQERAAERKEQAAREASRSVREVYRRLASALHPDRETDAAERERKTRLMQRANQAYERGDLLELLALQIEIEQIDSGALANVPQERLRHYNEVLREQLRALKAQVAERVMGFRFEFELAATAVIPQHVDQALSVRIAEARSLKEEIERDLKRLDDPRQRHSLLDGLPEIQEDDAPDLEDLAALAALFGEPLEPRRPPPRRRRRKKR